MKRTKTTTNAILANTLLMNQSTVQIVNSQLANHVFLKFKQISGRNKCHLCNKEEPKKLVIFVNMRENIEIYCGNKDCFSAF